MGRKIGYPTANIAINDPNKIVPSKGVYAVRVIVNNILYKGMLNIGNRPTMNNGNNTSIEVNIFDFNADIYGSVITIEFIRKIRDEKKFESIEKLIEQIHRDKTEVSQLEFC